VKVGVEATEQEAVGVNTDVTVRRLWVVEYVLVSVEVGHLEYVVESDGVVVGEGVFENVCKQVQVKVCVPAHDWVQVHEGVSVGEPLCVVVTEGNFEVVGVTDARLVRVIVLDAVDDGETEGVLDTDAVNVSVGESVDVTVFVRVSVPVEPMVG
jgi:hypothetical protein